MSDVLVIAPPNQAALDQGQAALMEATYHGWLLSLPPERVIGSQRHSTRCPLCRFLYEQTGRRWLIDSRRAYLIDTLAYAPGLVLPGWVERHIVQLDALGDERVTVGAALFVLEGSVA